MANEVTGEPITNGSRFFYGYIIVVASFFIMVVVHGLYTSFGIFLKPMASDFGWTRAAISVAFSFCMITQGLLAIAMGGLNDKFGPRLVMTLCGFLLGLGYLFMSQINSLLQLYVIYGLIIGGAMSGTIVPLTSTVARWFTDRRSLMTGFVLAGIGIGQFTIPPVANRLISSFGWRISFVTLGSIILVVVVLAAQLLKHDPSSVGLVAYGEDKQQEYKLGKGFSLREAVCTNQFWLFFTMQFCFAFCLFVILVHIVAHITELGISTATATRVFASMGAISIIGKVLLGRLADKIGNKQIFVIGFTLMIVAFLCLVPATAVWVFYLFGAVFSVAYGGMIASQSPLAAALFGLRSHGVILGIISVGVAVGGAVGPFVAGYVFDVTHGYSVIFIACAVISAVGLILTALISPTKRN